MHRCAMLHCEGLNLDFFTTSASAFPLLRYVYIGRLRYVLYHINVQ